MRDLVKSLNRFSWAMSLYGAQELIQLVRRPGADRSPAADLTSATQAGERQLDGSFRRAFEAGDRVQRSVVDLMFGVVTLEALDPNRLAALSADVLRQSTAALWSLWPGSRAAGSRSCGEPCGWGPMPPAR